jgi:hypothetical protein
MQSIQTVALSKGAASMTAGVAAHDVAVGDTAGVVWLYDLRRADAPLWRLQCDERVPVTAVTWTQGKSTAGSSTQGAPASNEFAGASARDREVAQAADSQVGIGRSRLPAQPIGLSRTAPASSASAGSQGANASAERNNVPDKLPATSASSIFDVGTPASTTPPPQLHPTAAPQVDLSPRRHKSDAAGGVSARAVPFRPLPGQHVRSSSATAASEPKRGASAPLAGISMPPAELQTYIREAVSGAFSNHSAAPSVPAMPALHTQQLKDYIDAAIAREVGALRQDLRSEVASLRADIQGWMMKQNNDILKQAQLAQDDAYELNAGVMEALGAVQASVQQVQHKMDEDDATRRNLGHWA